MAAKPPRRTTTHALGRLREAEAARPVRFAWAIVGSTWVHIGLATLFLVKCSTNHDADVRVERPVTLVVADFERRELAQEGESPASTSRDGSPADDVAAAEADQAARPISAEEIAALDPESLRALPPEAFDLADPALLDELTPAQLAALRELELPAELLAALLAALEADRVEARAREVGELPELSAAPARVPAIVDSAVAPDRDTPPALADAAGADSTGPDRDEEAADPADALADAALPLDDATLDRDEDPDEERSFDEVEPEPEDEAPRKDPRWAKFLHADGSAEAGAADPDSEYISNRDSRAIEERRTEVVADVDGALSRPIVGVPIQEGTPAKLLADGEPDGATGDLPASGEPVVATHEQRQGGGSRGQAPGAGAPDRGGETRGGPLARSGRRAAPALPAIVLNGGPAGRDGSPDAPRGERRAAARSAAWWAPSVQRVVIPAPVSPPADAAVSTPLHTEATHAAPNPRPDEKADRGGTERPTPTDEPIPDEPNPADTPEDGEADEQEEVPEVRESVSDLRDALGWGGVDRSRLKPRRTLPGTEASDGNRPTSPQVADDDLRLDQIAFVDAVETPAGRYRAAIDEEIGDAWRSMDLSLHERMMGIQGDVTIVFHVQRNGRVTDTTIVRQSGYASLDRMALDSIPERLPRFPKDLDTEALYHRYTFRYRNPIIVREGGG